MKISSVFYLDFIVLLKTPALVKHILEVYPTEWAFSFYLLLMLYL
jgi:hypothetical protein